MEHILAIQNNYKINVSDDFEFMCCSPYFIKNVGEHFDIVNYDEESPNECTVEHK